MPNGNKHILIAEDEDSLREILTVRLSKEGYRISQAVNGQEAFDKALADVPDLLLLDILMPVMDGITALKKMRETEKLKNVKVVFLTNFNDSEKIAQAMEQKFSDYLIKSDWDLNDIVEKIKKILDH